MAPRRAGVAVALALLIVLSPAAPAVAEARTGTAALPLWERTLYKTLTYQAAANISDLTLFALVLGGSAGSGAAFLAVNAASAATLYYGFEYAWAWNGLGDRDATTGGLAAKTAAYRVLNAGRNLLLGQGFGAGLLASTAFVAANFVTDSAIFATNEAAWSRFRPTPGTP